MNIQDMKINAFNVINSGIDKAFSPKEIAFITRISYQIHLYLNLLE
jgi:hypothetical protein